MIEFLIASYVKETGCTSLARQIAKYCAAGGSSTVLVTESSLYDRLKQTDTEYRTLSPRDSIPEDTDIVVRDYGDSSGKVIREDSADRIYVITDARRISAEILENRFNSTPFTCTLVLYGTNDMSAYKKLGQKIIKTACIENGECQYEIRLDLDLFSHQRGFDVPDPSQSFRYEPLVEKSEEPAGDIADGLKSGSKVLGIAGIPFFRKNTDRTENQKRPAEKGADETREEAEPAKGKIDEDDGESDFRPEPGKIEYEDSGSFKDRLSSFAAGAAGVAASAVSGAMKKKLRKDGPDEAADKESSEKNVDKDSRKADKKTDWSKKAHEIEVQTKNVGHIFSAVNAVLIISVILMAVFTFLAFRDTRHRMVTNRELVKTEYPVRVETDGISVTNYSGIAKNRKVAVVIGDDEFVKPYNKTFRKLEKKEAVETRKYEIDVTYTDNPILQTFFGTLKFVHHSAFGEGEFSKEEVAEIMDYSRKWFSKKRYDFFGFNDKDTINVNDPPDSLLRETD